MYWPPPALAGIAADLSSLLCCLVVLQEERHVAAVFSLRITADSRQEVVGGADVYAPVCRRHYVQLSQVREVPLSSSDEA